MFEKLAQVVLMLVSVMMISSVFKEANIMGGLYYHLDKRIHSKKTLIALMSLIFGILPIPGRIIFACGILDSVQEKGCNNQKMGVIAYLASHHYYLWSPIEKAVIIVYTALGIGYAGFLYYMWIPAVIAIIFSFAYIYTSVSEAELNLVEPVESNSDWKVALISLLAVVIWSIVFPEYTHYTFFIYSVSMMSYYRVPIRKVDIDFTVLAMASLAILGSSIVGFFASDFTAFVASFKGTLVIALCASFVASFTMGSSAKYGALCAVMVKFFGIKFLPLFYLVDYAGYLISPTHSCVPIAKQYFKTPVGMFTLPLLLLSIILVAYASITTLL
jgi:hypothetical protein